MDGSKKLKSNSKTAKSIHATLSALNRKGGLDGVVPRQFAQDIRFHARKQGIPENLAKTIVLVESRGVVNAGSNKGAYGFFQLLDTAAQDRGVDRFNPSQNIKGGIEHFKVGLREFNGDVEKAIAAYNWGIGSMKSNVRRNGENWRANLPVETSNYLAQFRAVLNNGRPLS